MYHDDLLVIIIYYFKNHVPRSIIAKSFTLTTTTNSKRRLMEKIQTNTMVQLHCFLFPKQVLGYKFGLEQAMEETSRFLMGKDFCLGLMLYMQVEELNSSKMLMRNTTGFTSTLVQSSRLLTQSISTIGTMTYKLN
jgi:hypothetical protein